MLMCFWEFGDVSGDVIPSIHSLILGVCIVHSLGTGLIIGLAIASEQLSQWAI